MADIAKVRIVNTALGAMGQEPVSDLSDASLQASAAASRLLRIIEQARDAVLRRHLWLCAKAFVTLPPSVIDGDLNFSYPTVFLAPGDCLRVWEIAGEPWSGSLAGGWGARWEVGTLEYGDTARTVIRAGAGCGDAALTSLDLAYVRRAAWSALDAQVADAVAYDVAARCAWTITGDRGLASDLRKEAERLVLLAMGVDGTQDGGQPAEAPSIPAAIRACSR